MAAKTRIILINSYLKPEKNALIDSDQFGTDIMKNIVYTNSNFNYVKHGLDITIKVDIDAQGSSEIAKGNLCNYVSIQNANEPTFWYFVVDQRWLAEHTLELTLSIDSLNTFRDELLDMTNWTSKTNIQRQHKDRFYNKTYDTPSGTVRVPKIDKMSEGITGLTNYRKSRNKITGSLNEPTKWYLYYKNGTGDQAGQLLCYIMPNDDIQVKASDGTVGTVAAIKDVIRTQVSSVRLIELPYRPFDAGVEIVSGTYTVKLPTWAHLEQHSSDTKYDIQLNRITDTAFKSVLLSNNLNALVITSDNEVSTEPHNVKYETKLLHSDFYKQSYVYDTFNNEIRLEDISLANTTDANFYLSNLQCIFSSNFKSTFLIESKLNYPYRENTSYDRFLTCSRNNELSLYTSDYLEYIQNGINYDVKAKNIQGHSAMAKTLATAASTAAIAGIAAGSGGVAGVSATTAVAGALASGVSSITNTAITAITQDQLAQNSIDQKKYELMTKGVNLQTADDISLLHTTCDNKIYQETYDLTDNAKNNVYNLLRLTGYTCNTYGKPDLTSRRNYNYVQCTPVFKESLGLETYINDIKARFASGVTVYHHTSTGIDWDQEKENWETFIVGR